MFEHPELTRMELEYRHDELVRDARRYRFEDRPASIALGARIMNALRRRNVARYAPGTATPEPKIAVAHAEPG